MGYLEKMSPALFMGRAAVRNSGDCGTYSLTIVGVHDGEKIRNLSDCDSPMADLTVNCQWDAKKPEHVYAMEAEYRAVYAVDVVRAEAMAKTLRTVKRFLDRSPVRPETFGQFALLVAQALKIKLLVIDRSLRPVQWHTEGEYQILNSREIQSRVDSALYLARWPEGKPEPAPAPAAAV